jgi:hypothetical protein
MANWRAGLASCGLPVPPRDAQVEGRNWKRPPAPEDGLTACGLPPDSSRMMHAQTPLIFSGAAGAAGAATTAGGAGFGVTRGGGTGAGLAGGATTASLSTCSPCWLLLAGAVGATLTGAFTGAGAGLLGGSTDTGAGGGVETGAVITSGFSESFGAVMGSLVGWAATLSTRFGPAGSR